jgi:hypothetical protein
MASHKFIKGTKATETWTNRSKKGIETTEHNMVAAIFRYARRLNTEKRGRIEKENDPGLLAGQTQLTPDSPTKPHSGTDRRSCSTVLVSMEMEVSGLESAGDVELHELDLLVNSERKKNSTGDLARE